MNAEQQQMLSAMIDMLSTDKFKDNLLKELNENVDIPILNEKKEGKVFKALYKIFIQTLEKAATKDKTKDE